MSTSTIDQLTLKVTIDGTELVEISEGGAGSFKTTTSAFTGITNFPSGTGLQVLRRNTGNTALEFATISAGSGITSINGDATAAQVIAGTTNRISINDSGATHTLDIAATYVGQASITTLGTITTGVWNGTVVTSAFLDADTMHLSVVQTITATKQMDPGIKFTVDANATNSGFRDLGHTADPSAPFAGDLYYNTTSNVFRFYNGTVWGAFGGGASSLNDLSDVTIASAAAAQILIYNAGATAMENQTVSGDITITAAGVTTIGNGVIENGNIADGTGITLTKLAPTGTNRALITDGSGFIDVATTTSTEIGFVNGVTSAIQTQLDAGVTNEQDDRWKEPVRVATTANITLSGEQTIDGILTSTDRVLVKDQSTGSENGIYVTAAGAWTRALDWDGGTEAEGAIVYCRAGTANGTKAWKVDTVGTITIGTTAVVITPFSDQWGPYGDSTIDAVSGGAVQGAFAWGRLAYTTGAPAGTSGLPVKSTFGSITARLMVFLSINTTTVGTTISVLKNGSATALTLSPATAGGSGLYTADGTVDFAEGDRIGLLVDRTGDGGAITPDAWTVFEI